MNDSSTNRYFVVLNPKAGNSSLWRSFSENWSDLPNAEVRSTERAGHAQELGREAVARGFDRLIAVGGDGTMSEVADGLLRLPRLPSSFAVVHLPAGSGRDFARHFQIPLDPKDWSAFLKNGVVTRIDVGRVIWKSEDGKDIQRHFVNAAMAGLPGDIARTCRRTGKPLGGFLTYLLVSLSHILRSRPKSMALRIDGTDSTASYHFISANNISSTGGGMKIAPGAKCDDGRFDIITAGPMNRGRLLSAFAKIYSGEHIGLPEVGSFTAATIEGSSVDDIFMNVDGEAIGRFPARIEIIPRSLPILLPN